MAWYGDSDAFCFAVSRTSAPVCEGEVRYQAVDKITGTAKWPVVCAGNSRQTALAGWPRLSMLAWYHQDIWW